MALSTARELKVPSLVDAVYSAIRERILSGELPGGTPITEMDLAANYSVARPTAKSAMERLVHEGLLTRSTNKTARVPVMSGEDIRDLYFSRAFLEREVMVTLASRKLVPETARKYVAEMQQLTAAAAVSDVVRVDIAFHQALFDALGSPRLNRLYASLMGEVHLCMAQVQANRLLSASRIAAEHADILSAIEAGARKRAADEITSHLSRACDQLVQHVGASTAGLGNVPTGSRDERPASMSVRQPRP
jgi:DNA-binding GntR family transcriptional regulator